MAFRHLGEAGTRMIQGHYSLEQCLPRMLALYQEALDQPHQTTGGSNST
jgi:hypothetical protein